MKQLIFILFVLVVFFASHLPAEADVEMPRSVVGSGGGKLANVSYIISGSTLGQAAIGVVSGPSDEHEIGFWYGGRILISVDGPPGVLPLVNWLGQNYPNPFNPVTTLEFSLERRSRVRIALYDVTGRVVRTIVDDELNPGPHRVVFDASSLASGVYFCRMEAEKFMDTRKFVLLK